MQPRAMVVTDLDGTLSHPSGVYTEENLRALRELGAAGFLRVVATGRSLFMARRLLAPDFPIDYLVFSSGAGILEWREQRLLVAHHLSAGDVTRIENYLVSRRLDFMRHEPVPDNHRFAYWASGNDNPDFVLRCQRQAAYGSVWRPANAIRSSQFLVIVPPTQADAVHEELTTALVGMNVIRATSPLDRQSAWLEVFGEKVSKSQAAQWLAERHRLTAAGTLAIGNDYNDQDLLEWAGCARVVADAPAELCRRFTVVKRHEDSGFAAAVTEWLAGGFSRPEH